MVVEPLSGDQVIVGGGGVEDRTAFPLAGSSDEILDHVVSRGCFAPDVNRSIFKAKYTYTRPRDRLIQQLDRTFHFSSGTILDAGCGWGSHVALGQAGSYGIEREDNRHRFTNSIGLTCYQLDLEEDDLSHLPRVDTVFCLAVLEHVGNQHSVLRKLMERLRPEGYIVISVPARAIWPTLEPLPFFQDLFTGEHGDHVNGYVPQTLAFQCERAGFHNLRTGRFCTPLLSKVPGLPLALMNRFPLSTIGNGCFFVGQKVASWQYSRKAMRRRADNKQGFVADDGYINQGSRRNQPTN